MLSITAKSFLLLFLIVPIAFAEEGLNPLPEKIKVEDAYVQINEEFRKLDNKLREARGLSFVSRTTYSGDQSATIQDLEPGFNYLLFLDVKASASGNVDFMVYPNGTLSAPVGSTDYVDFGGPTGTGRLHSSSGFNSGGNSIGSWIINIRTIVSDDTRTIIQFNGYTDADSGLSHGFIIFNSDVPLSQLTLSSADAGMTLTGVADLYRYSTN